MSAGDVPGAAGTDPAGVSRDDADDVWAPLRATTKARIGLGHRGGALPTREVLALREAHALARDAIHTLLEVEPLLAGLAGLGLGEPVHVTSRARDREEYVRRPDLGRQPGEGIERLTASGRLARGDADGAGGGPDLGIVLMDGLSSRALTDHGLATARALVDAVGSRWTIAPPVLATQGRVALGDHLGQALGVQTVLVVVGERPGLSVADSLSIYLTHRPVPGLPDSARNCISNIHPPDGLDHATAARTAIALVAGARELGESGVRLKDSGGALTDGAG